MNLSGLGLYSRATMPLKSPKLNQHLHFIFIYPMIVDVKLLKYDNLFRDYISLNFLKEIFISNSLDLISMISSYTDVKSMVTFQNQANPDTQQQTHMELTPNYYLQQMIQQRIIEKIGRIKEDLRTDPNLSKFRALVDVVSLENMVEVPVIVGTKSLQVDSSFLFYLLLAAVGQNCNLNSEANLNKCITAISNLSGNQLSTLFDNLQSKEPGILTRLFTRIFGNGRPTTTHSVRIPSNLVSSYSINKSSIMDGKIIFDKVLNSSKLNSEFGLDVGSQSVKMRELISPKLDMFTNEVMTTYLNIVDDIGNSVLIRFINTISHQRTRLSFLNFQEEFTNNVAQGIQGVLGSEIKNELLASVSEQQNTDLVKIMKEMCTKQMDIAKFIDRTSRLIRGPYGTTFMMSPMFSKEDFHEFVVNLATLANKCVTYNSEVKHLMFKFINGLDRIFDKIMGVISTELTTLRAPYLEEIEDDNYNNVQLLKNNVSRNEFDSWIQNGSNYIAQLYLMVFCFSVQSALCKLVHGVEGDIQVTSHDALSFPNYTLVLPLEIITIINTILTARSWNQLLTNKNVDVGSIPKNPVDSYIKGAIKEVNKILNIPNLIVVDELKNEAYIKVMSTTDISKIKLSNIASYVESTKKRYQ